MGIETKVVKILSDTTLVLGAGEEKRVYPGLEFIIYELGSEIIDPETQKSLGRLEIVKGRVEVIHVQPQMSTARTTKHVITKRRRSPLFPGLFGTTEETVEVRDFEKLRIENPEPDFSKRLVVRVGDLARSVPE